jgi:hypothetical protein
MQVIKIKSDAESNIIHKERPNFTGGIEDASGLRIWYKDGEIHNEIGPAVVFPFGLTQWFLDSICYDTEALWQQELLNRRMKRIVST